MQAQIIEQAAANYLAEYQRRPGVFSSESVSHLASQAVALFFDYFHATGSPLRQSIHLLCEIATSPDPNHAQAGLNALFPSLIEKLNDSFEPTYCELYDRLFAQVISFCRQLTEGRAIDAALNRFGLGDENSILSRKRALPDANKILSVHRPLKKIIFLSRVTIGADVAVTSVMMARLKQLFPDIELVLLGSNKLRQIFGGDPRIRIRQLDYGRSGGLVARLHSWLDMVNAVEGEISGLNPQEYCLFDPDSRFTQLGLLPVLSRNDESQCYYFFESRSYSRPGIEKLGQLTSLWLDGLCRGTMETYPCIFMPSDVASIGHEVLQFLRSLRSPHIICLSFGTGGNSIKRVSEKFEIKLATALSNSSTLIIDRGITTDETEQVNRILSALEMGGKITVSVNEDNFRSLLSNIKTQPDVLTWQGSIGSFASLIAASDEYIGYDSSGQHLAAALQTPTLTVFVNSGSNHFPARWQPHGSGTIKVIHLEPSQIHSNESILNELPSRVFLKHQQLCDR